ncbi:MAG TPA: AAA family ATPase [Ktedonobacteraceae bacterium]|nr:AAA family ATPase [Ktedonobacteraceae bacterium]
MMKKPVDTSLLCPVLIGRTNELALCRSLLEQAQQGKGALVLISGEAGIGKSRLVAEVKSEAVSHTFFLFQGSCFPTNSAIPYAPLLDLLRSFLSGRSPVQSSSEIHALTQAFLPLLPDLRHELPFATPSVPDAPLAPEQEKRRRFEMLIQYLIIQAREHPVLCILEDLHWSDDTSLEFLHYLARRCASSPLLLFLTYRSDEISAGLRHFLAQRDREHLAREIALVQLTRNEIDTMVRAIFAFPRSARAELVDPIYALTEGNPFFVEEILKSLIASGEISATDGHWKQKKPGEWRIPRSVQDAVQRRVHPLSAPALRVLTLAAVAGRRFDFSLLQHLTSSSEEHLLTFMKELLFAQLVVEESAEQFAFSHALTRQAIYTSLLARERRLLHASIAELLERLSPPDTSLADLAYHFFEAGVWEKALMYGQRAGERASLLYTPHAAIEQLTRALAAAQQGALAPSLALYQLRGQAYEMLGDFEHALRDDEMTLQLARDTGERHVEWQALMALGSLWAERDYTQTARYYQQALTLARSSDDPHLVAHSLNRLGNWYVNTEQPAVAQRYHQEALTLFQQKEEAERGYLRDSPDLRFAGHGQHAWRRSPPGVSVLSASRDALPEAR